MEHYTIYAKRDIKDTILYPNHIYAKDLPEAIEILCASENSQKVFLNDLKDVESKNTLKYNFVDIKSYDKESGYLLTDQMKVKIGENSKLYNYPGGGAT